MEKNKKWCMSKWCMSPQYNLESSSKFSQKGKTKIRSIGYIIGINQTCAISYLPFI